MVRISPTKKTLWFLALCAAFGLMWAGAHFDEPMRTMMNAFMLCLSCIGIG